MDVDGLFAIFDGLTLSQPPPAVEPDPLALQQVLGRESSAKKKQQRRGPLRDLPEYDHDLRVETVLQVRGKCHHQVTYPSRYACDPVRRELPHPAKTYPFELDLFQKEAIFCIEGGQSVMVSAHTSAGENGHCRIRPLSNQKLRDFTEEFQDVGLMTGDVTINGTANCLIMTTEILRSMLYRGSDVTKSVAWVIFDEVHYMRDKERGVIWEETLILLSDDVRFVFLSATIPNALQFAQWVSWLHRQPVHVISTEHRPVPLEFYACSAGEGTFYQIMDEDKNLLEENIKKCLSETEKGTGKADRFQRGKKGGFGRLECEQNAKQLQKLDFNTETEKASVGELFSNAIDLLSEEDQKLPQVTSILPILRRGIGIHHGGLLPIIKEVVELLFSEGLIKVLFATETFAMGLNMPARTVFFTCIRKFDGTEFRNVNPGEFIQMSGRAGRRGLDSKGTVIVLVDQEVSAEGLKTVINGAASSLDSAFHVTNNMILNMMRIDGRKPENLMEKSFLHFQKLQSIPQIVEEIREVTKEIDKLDVDAEKEVDFETYQDLHDCLGRIESQMWEVLERPNSLRRLLQPGRVVRIKRGDKDFKWGVCLRILKQGFRKATPASSEPASTKAQVVLLARKNVQSPFINDVQPLTLEDVRRGEEDIRVFSVGLDWVHGISPYVLQNLPKELQFKHQRLKTLNIIKDVNIKIGHQKFSPQEILKNLTIPDPELKVLQSKHRVVAGRMKESRVHRDQALQETFQSRYLRKVALTRELETKVLELNRRRKLLHMEELSSQKRIFRTMGFIDSRDVVLMKGKIACEIECQNEILLTELLLNGTFVHMDHHVISALLSCFVFEEKVKNPAELPEHLKRPFEEVQSLWSKGASFHAVCQSTDVFEGSIIRALRRLNELLAQMFSAASFIGSNVLELRFSQCIQFIKRDIVFAASLYI
ncbi:SKIV2L2 [Cordylochernes scorpioides]|uniref:SKIV2L2 n=1 Tax=Cordylochernes scorpioides TaxID=51811 RepID=A0ABY6L534_9ARAC|nr:SKIV2L2 [Cordylochernes scorpioides]